MMHVDDVTVAMTHPAVAVRVAVRLGTFPTLVLMLVMLVMGVKVLVLKRGMLVLKLSEVRRWPKPHGQEARGDHEYTKKPEGPQQADFVADHAGDQVGDQPAGVRERELGGEQGGPILLMR